MAKHIAYFEYGRVYPTPEGQTPLVKGALPQALEPEPEPEYTPPRLRICRVLALLWYAVFAGIFGGCIITLLSYPPLPALWPPDWPECAIGSIIGVALCGITLLVRMCEVRN